MPKVKLIVELDTTEVEKEFPTFVKQVLADNEDLEVVHFGKWGWNIVGGLKILEVLDEEENA